MIRPWMGVLAVVVGFAALPCSAMAQDTTGPTINLVTPAENAAYTLGQPVNASYACSDEASAVVECAGTVANGTAVNTSTPGTYTFTVNARDAANNTSTLARTFTVSQSTTDPGDVGGTAPATLQLTLGQAAAFSPFLPGQARDYTTTMAATVLSSAADATLSVADAGAQNTGHLVNGTYFLPRVLEVGAAHAGQPVTSTAPVGGIAAPTNVLTWDGPTTNEVITLSFKQSIAATDSLRTGAYAKTLTFTLSTTNP